MSDYTLHLNWGWWQETLRFYNREAIIKYLQSGFVPEDCKLSVEHESEFYEWDRNADYANPYRYNMSIKSVELRKQLKAS